MTFDRVYRAKCNFPGYCDQRLYRITSSALQGELAEAGWVTLGSLHFCGPGSELQQKMEIKQPNHAAKLGDHRPAHRKTGETDFARRRLILAGCTCGWRYTGRSHATRKYADDDWLGDHIQPDVLGMKSRQQQRDEYHAAQRKLAQEHTVPGV